MVLFGLGATGASAVANDAGVSASLLEDTRVVTPREVAVDPALLGTEGPVDYVVYDVSPALRPVRLDELATLPDVALAVRLVLSEVGPDRLLGNRNGLFEAIGVIQTVFNRLDPVAWNPEGVDGVRPWPGCDADGTFRTCAAPSQYLGLKQSRGLRPRESVRDPQRLLAATDVAVAAWWLVSTGRAPDVAAGGTSFVHRCGGAAYGARTIYCDGRGPTADTAGANPRTGPIVFKAPGHFQPDRGFYTLRDAARIDYASADDDWWAALDPEAVDTERDEAFERDLDGGRGLGAHDALSTDDAE